MTVNARKKWIKTSGLRALYTMLDVFIGLFVLEAASLLALNWKGTAITVLAAGIVCFLRSVMIVLRQKLEVNIDDL